MRLAVALAVLLAGLLGAAPVAGADRRAGADPRFELTPFAGFRIGGSFEDQITGADLELDEGSAFGLLLGIPLDDQSIVEIEFVHHETELESGGLFDGEPLFDLDINSIMAGGRYQTDHDRVKGFVAGGLGLAHLEPTGAGLDDEFAAVLSIGGGALIPLGKHVLVRLEGRGIGTFMIDRTEAFCTEGVCGVIIEGEGFLQAEFRAGLTISF